MTLYQALNQVKTVLCKESHPLFQSVSDLIRTASPNVNLKIVHHLEIQSQGISLAIADQLTEPEKRKLLPSTTPENFLFLKLEESGTGCLIASHRYYLYGFVQYLLSDLLNEDIMGFRSGRIFEPAFKSHRVAYDYFLTQEGRISQGLNRESYMQELARNGFTHVEVNGLGSPMGIETGPKGEVYPMFYTYCPALDQFVYSSLNKGIYPYYYLSANLNYLKENARLARKYGLIPGMLSFEPRAVPEEFFNKYPMLRGCRVDHPFRSFRPRYNMTITHPKVLDHYAEMIQKLTKEVPDLGFLNIWTNDSGAGFEHTKSLYVGRNGGAYLVREWKDDAEIARLAGDNALRFFGVLKDAATKLNPDFRIITRMESFYGEHDIIINGLKGKLDIETASLIQRGWDMPYSHPLYPDRKDINAGCVFQQDFDEREKPIFQGIEKEGSQVSFYYAYGPQTMFAPLMGIPYPKLTHKRLETLHRNGVNYLAHMGGTFPPETVPYNINHEVLRNFQLNSGRPVEELLETYVRKHVSGDGYQALLKAWDVAEAGILGFPNISSLYSTIGFTWYRLWVRPFVPDIEKIPQKERDFYEDFMCTVPHNPNNVDLSKDVLFTLTTPQRSHEDAQRIDRNVLPKLTEAILMLEEIRDQAPIFKDQWVRLKALRAWMLTMRNIAVWVDTVYGYMNAPDPKLKEEYKLRNQAMMKLEITNTEEVISLFGEGVDFMALTDQGETPLIYGVNLPELMSKRIEMMQAHFDDDPFIDHNFIERMAGMPLF
ncbi:MAG TPA: hypothetical protein DC042_12670 [Bacteroidales bacterium]|nr:hypothetical protein [Bacteroidales bacterium]